MDYTWFLIIFLIVVVIAYFGLGGAAPAAPVTGHGEFDIVEVSNGVDGAGESWDEAV